MTHGSSCDMAAPSCDMFNLGSSYFHVARTTVRHLLIVVRLSVASNNNKQVQSGAVRARWLFILSQPILLASCRFPLTATPGYKTRISLPAIIVVKFEEITMKFGKVRDPHSHSITTVIGQEAQLSPMRRVSWNLANCHATVQKLLVRQGLN